MKDDLLDGPIGTAVGILLILYIGWLFWTGVFYIYDHIHWSWP